MTPPDTRDIALPPRRVGWGRTALRLVVLAAFIGLLHLLARWGMSLETQLASPGPAPMGLALWAGVLLIYALLIAVPFMPGIEIGLALLLMYGAVAAPLVWAATVVGLSLAFLVGWWVPYARLHAIAADLRQARLCALIDAVAATPTDARLPALRARLPRPVAAILGGQRYVLLALLINLPGSALIGGGGGLAFVAGLSRLFAPAVTILVFVIACAPLPLTVWIWGTDMLGLWPLPAPEPPAQ